MACLENNRVLQAPAFSSLEAHIAFIGNFHRVKPILHDENHANHDIVHGLKMSGKLNNFLTHARGAEVLESPNQWFARPQIVDAILESCPTTSGQEQMQGMFSSLASGFLWQLGNKACGAIFSRALEHSDNLKHLTEKIMLVVDKVLSAFDWIAELVDNASEFFKKIKEKVVGALSGAFSKLKDLLNHFSYMLPLVCGVLITANVFFLINKILEYLAPQYQMSSFRLIEVLILIGTVIGIKEVTQFFFAFSSAEKLEFVNVIRNFFGIDSSAAGMNSAQVAEAANGALNTEEAIQSGLLDLSVFGSVIACLSLFMDRGNKEWIQRISYSASFIKNSSDAYDKSAKIIANISDWLFTKLGSSNYAYGGAAQALLLHSGVGIHDWLERCEDIMVRGNTQELPFEEILRATRELLDQGKKISEFLLSTDDGMTFVLRQRFLACDKSMRDFYGKMVQSKIVNQFRATPFVTVFYGQAGVGKSTVSRLFANDFLDQMGEPQVDRVYSRNPGDAYWSSYIRQPLVLFDDFAQIVQSNGVHDESSLVQLVTCNAHLLPMAAVEEKGRPFDSKYLVLCTNNIHISPTCAMAEPEAFYRRRHLFWKVEKNPDVPYNPARCYDNLWFTLQDSKQADLVHDAGLVRIGYLEMVAYTADKASEFREKEMIALRSLEGDRGAAMMAIRNLRVQGGLQAANEEIQAPVPTITVFDLPQHYQPNYTYPNFEARRAENGEDGVLCFGSEGFFDLYGNTLSFVDWTDSEIIVSDKIDRERTRWDVEGALRYMLHVTRRDLKQHNQFLKMVDRTALLERNIVTSPGKSEMVILEMQEHWDRLGDATRYLTKSLLEMNGSDIGCSLWTRLRESLAKIDCKAMWSQIPTWCKWSIGIIALFAAKGALYSVLNGIGALTRLNATSFIATMLGFATNDSLQSTSSGGDERMSRAARRSIRGFRIQSGMSEELPHQGAWEKCEKARVAIEGSAAYGAHRFITIYGVCVGERKILIPHHFLVLMNWNLPCYLRNGDDRAMTFFASEAHFQYPKYDTTERVKFGNMAIINYSQSISALPCYPLMDFERATEGPGNFKGFIMSNLNNAVKHDPLICNFERNLVRDEIELAGTGIYWRNDHTFVARTAGKSGMCGRLALQEKNGTLYIVGVHNFGNNEYSRFSDIPREFAARESIQADVELAEADKPEQITPMVVKIGQVSKAAPKLSKTQIIKSQIFNELVRENGPPVVEPTVLSGFDPRPSVPYDPYVSGIRKFDKEAGPFDFSEEGPLLRARRNISSEWERLRPVNFPIAPVCTLEVAIQGVDGLEFAESLPVGTSEGFPYCFDRKAGDTGKLRYFEEVNGKRYPKGDWPNDVSDIIETARTQPPEIFTMACAKDEKTKLSKIYDVPKTRIFEILPFTFNLAIRQYFMFWMQWLMKNHMNLPCKVGLNPYSFSWDEMAAKHGAYLNHFCGDYSGFDTNTNVSLIVMIADMVSDFARDGMENKNIRRNLMLAAVTRKVLVGRDCYKVTGGTPSGFALTVMVNSVVNELYLKMSWFALANNRMPELARDQDLNYHVHMSVYGDDNVVSFTSHVAQWYNLQTIADFLKQFGVVLTDGKKSGIIVPSMPFEHIDFLKRRWVKEDVVGWFKCPLDKVSIESQLYWIKKSEDDVAALRLNVENSLREAAQHGKEYFHKWRGIISRALVSASIVDIFPPTYEDAIFFWKQQRTAENLPLHYDDPLSRIRFLTTHKEGNYGSVFCRTTAIINKHGSRRTVDKMNALFVTSHATSTWKSVMPSGAKHTHISSKLNLDEIAFCIHELIHGISKDVLMIDRGEMGRDPLNELVVVSDSELWLAHAIGAAIAVACDSSSFKKTTWVSGLTDKAYQIFVELHGKLVASCNCMCPRGS